MNHEDLEDEFKYYSVKNLVEKTLQEIQESMGLTDIDTGALGRNFNNVMDAINKATDIAIKTKNADLSNSLADLKNQIADIKLTLADRKDEIVAFREENFELREENKKLKEQLIKPQELILRGELYYKPNENRPFCPFCYELKDKQTHLLKEMGRQQQKVCAAKYICSVCKNVYKDPSDHTS